MCLLSSPLLSPYFLQAQEGAEGFERGAGAADPLQR